jgi:HAD superfamily hydrolase (TIGR01509 family)
MTRRSSVTASLPAAVLLDMDGLLVDTERIWFEVESAIVTELGGAWTDVDHDLLVGGPLERAVAHMVATAPSAPALADVTARLLGEMVAALRGGPLDWMPGAKLLLASIADAGVPTALVSSSRRPIVDAVLDAIGREPFHVTVSGDDVTRTKPNPDPYLHAAALLGVEVSRCVAIEDSVTGATSAWAAGCVTVLVPSIPDLPAEVVARVAHRCLDSLTELDLAVLSDLVGSASP